MSNRRTRSSTQFDSKETRNIEDEERSRSLKVEKTSLSRKLLNMNIEQQKSAVVTKFKEKYPENTSKELQINTVVSLINGDNTFLLAGTGYGKTRVSELFFYMHYKVNNPVVLVLNPLDALGDNQASEKHHVTHGLICLIDSFDLFCRS